MPKIIETNLKFRRPLGRRSKTDYIVLHHAAASRCTAEDIHRWHLERGWPGFGYHFLVRKDGTIYRGRPLDTIGTHVANNNGNTIGICAEGNFEVEKMPAVQQQALTELVAYLKTIYPQVKVVKHRDLSPSACPGKNYPFEQIAAGTIKKEVGSGVFKDVPNNHWAKASIERIAKLGLIVGDDRGNFNPNEPLTRAQFAAVVDRLLKFLGK